MPLQINELNALLLVFFIPISPLGALADVRVSEPNLKAGKITEIKGVVTLNPIGGGAQKPAKEDSIFIGEKIETRKGHLQIELRDESVLVLGQHTQAEITEFLFESERATAHLEIQINKGYFQYRSGKISKQNLRSAELRFPIGFVWPGRSGLMGKITEGQTLVIHTPPNPSSPTSLALGNQTQEGIFVTSIHEVDYSALISGKASKPSFPFKTDKKDWDEVIDKLNPNQILESAVAEEGEEAES